MFLTDVFGKSASSIMKEVLSSNVINDEKIVSLLNKSTKKKSVQILDSLKGSRIENDQRLKMNISFNHKEELDKHIEDIEIEMTKRVLPYKDFFVNILQMPGISFVSAMIIISEIGVDMTQFQSDKELCSWAGLAPANNESANKKKSVRISKAGIYLKPILVQCALSAIKSTSQPYYRTKYDRIKKRRGHKKAIIAIARMLLTSIYHMILTGEVFNPSDIDTYNKPTSSKHKLTPELALQYLKESGYDISSISIN